MATRLAALAPGLALITLGPPASAGAIEPGGTREGQALFPFVIPWDDAVQGTATDVSALNPGPAGESGFIVVRDGVFVTERTGERIRFLATNLGARAAFPPGEDADRIAARMAKLGINLVRLHHLQNSWEKPGGTIWKGRPFVEVDPAQVDKLDRLVAALKRHGIYTNLNLSTTREYVPELGFPESVRAIPFAHHKKVDRFDRRMIELQKEYARALLAHVNPHTGLAYRDEPALAFVEINNENSLVGWPHEAYGEGLDALPEPFHAELVALWNAWLSGKYGDDAAVRAAWSGREAELGPSLVTKELGWQFENQSAPDAAAHEILAPTASGPGTGGIRLVVKKATGGEWLVQGLLPGLTLEEEALYTLGFRAKADRDRVIGLKVHLDRPDWQEHGLKAQARLGLDWREFRYTFRARSVVPGHSRIAFMAGGEPATIDIEGVTLRPGAAPWEPPAGQSLARRNLGLGTDAFHGLRLSDWVLFLLQTEKAYAEEMRAFLREDLKIRANLIDTQVQWGRLTALERESSMEYADGHAYWQHPEFTGGAWDPVHWHIQRRAHVDAMDGDQGVLADLALHRVAGRPYTVSEYNHPAPNDYQSEMMPLLATFASLQDWDAVYTFAYPPTGSGESNDVLEGFFDVGINPAKAAFYPSAALILRRGLVGPLVASDTLRLPPRSWETFRSAAEAWTRTGGRPDLLKTRVALSAAEVTAARRETASRGLGPDAPVPPVVRVRRNGRGAIYVVDAPAAKAVAGFVGGEAIDLGAAVLAFPSFGRGAEGFAALTLVDLEGRALSTSGRALLTLVGRAENRGMGWNPDRTSVGDKWGEGPVMAEGIPCEVTLRIRGHRAVWALDGNGQRRERVPVVRRSGALVFEADPRYRTVWYEIADR
jgi:hypothetical protein